MSRLLHENDAAGMMSACHYYNATVASVCDGFTKTTAHEVMQLGLHHSSISKLLHLPE